MERGADLEIRDATDKMVSNRENPLAAVADYGDTIGRGETRPVHSSGQRNDVTTHWKELRNVEERRENVRRNSMN